MKLSYGELLKYVTVAGACGISMVTGFVKTITVAGLVYAGSEWYG